MADSAGGDTYKQLRVESADTDALLKLAWRQVKVVEVVVQQLLSVIQAIRDLPFGQRVLSNPTDGVGEGGTSIRRPVGIAETVRRLDFVVRVGSADSVHYRTPDQFPSREMPAEAEKLRRQRR